ncbi:hypothetical protein M0804_009498 [Polistes exclamans]|nr:hypothetical protein M0804_009498 [Polistes exclamans]
MEEIKREKEKDKEKIMVEEGKDDDDDDDDNDDDHVDADADAADDDDDGVAISPFIAFKYRNATDSLQFSHQSSHQFFPDTPDRFFRVYRDKRNGPLEKLVAPF